MRLLITRPEPAATKLTTALSALGHEGVIAPLFKIIDLPTALPDLAGADALILSSASGVAAMTRRTAVRDIPVFAVGPQTASAARAAGFTDVHTGPGTGAELLQEVPAHSRCIHITAPEGKVLAREGLSITRAELYTSQAADTLPEAFTAALTGSLEGALFFSPRSALIFSELVQAAGLSPACAHLTAFCISQSTAEALYPVWGSVKVATRPNRAALLDLL